MKVVLTGAGSTLGNELAARLAPTHQLILLGDHLPDIPGTEQVAADGWEPEALKSLLTGVDVVVHGGCYHPAGTRGLSPEQAALDMGGRITYNLLLAAHQAEVRRLLVLSSLELLRDYDPDYLLGPDFEARPAATAEALSFHLAEAFCREVRRELGYFPHTLRLGRLVLEEEVADQPYDPFWLDRRDAVAAIAAVVEAEAPQHPHQRQWLGVIHLCAARPDSASRQGPLARWTGYRPQHNFGYQPEEAGS